MDKIKFIVDGKVHSINPAKQDLFLEKYPQAVPYSSEGVSSETSKRIDELVIESNSHDETDFQTEDNDRKANEMVDYEVEDGMVSQEDLSKGVQTAMTGAGGSVGGASGGITNWLWNSSAGKWIIDRTINTFEYFEGDEENGIIRPSLTPSVFELRDPDRDIYGKVI